MLKMSVKAMKDTLGTEGVVTSPVVFEISPKLSSAGDSIIPRHDLDTRVSASTQSCDENLKIARIRLLRALCHTVPSAAKKIMQKMWKRPHLVRGTCKSIGR